MYGCDKAAIYRRLNTFPGYKELVEQERQQRREDADFALAEIKDGISTNDVLDILGWERSRLDSMLRRNNVRISQQVLDWKQAWTEFKAGASTREIAARHGVERITVSRNFKQHFPTDYATIVSTRKGGRKPGARIGNTFDLDQAFSLYRSGLSVHQLAAMYDKSPATFSHAFRKYFGEQYHKLSAARLKHHRKSMGRRYPGR